MDKLNASLKNGFNSDVTCPLSPHSDSSISVSDHLDCENNVDLDEEEVEQVTYEIDRFTHKLTVSDDKSNPPKIPDTVETFSKIIESRIAKYSVPGARNVIGKMTEDDSFFIEAVTRIAKLTNVIGEFSSTSTTSNSLNRTGIVLQQAMTFMEDELRSLLEYNNSNLRTIKERDKNESDRCMLQPMKEDESISEDKYPGYSPEIVTKMSRYASAMILAGYETECCQVYSLYRMNALNEQLKRLEYEKINMDDIWKMNWDSLESEIIRWVNVVKNCSNIIFPGEKRLCDAVFSDHPSTSRSIFSSLARTVVIQLLDFAEATAMTQRAAEKLFKFLDMYESLRDLIPAIADNCTVDSGKTMRSEIQSTADRISDAAFTIFNDLENSIKNDQTKAAVSGGAVHPLTRYVMNYVNYTCVYKESLENKSKLYRDISLRYIFLMNNGRYILQKVKRSDEISQVMGENWCRRRSTIVRQFHKNYQRETWVKLLGGLRRTASVGAPSINIGGGDSSV